MTIKATTTWGAGTCYEGELEGYRVLAKVLDRPSRKGLGSGRIVELHIGKYGTFTLRDSVLCYKEEWFHSPPTDSILKRVVEQVVRQIDQKPVDWQREQTNYEATFRD